MLTRELMRKLTRQLIRQPIAQSEKQSNRHSTGNQRGVARIAAVGLAAAFAGLVGCSDEQASTYADQDQARLPTTPATEQAAPQGYSERTGGNQTAMEPSATAQPGMESSESSAIEQTEFAAFDTNSDGMLSEREFDSDDARSQVSLKNMSFAQIDQNADGAIDTEEFESARAVSDPAAPRGLTLDERPRE